MTEIQMKVAAAICGKLFGPFDPAELDRPSSVSAQSVEAARAAIEAMREPTVVMQRAGFLALDHKADCNCDQKDCWAAMVNAALERP